MAEELQRELRAVRDKLLANPVSPRVEVPADINLHYCRYVAETVVEALGDDYPVQILEDGGRGYAHTWLYHDGKHYDAECLEGVTDYRRLPFFERHPEAVIRVEPETTDPAELRARGQEPLYPAFLTPDHSGGPTRYFSTAYLRYAVMAVLLGIGLIALGVGGRWAIDHQLLDGPALVQVLATDFVILGELLVLVAPVVFFVLLPAHRNVS